MDATTKRCFQEYAVLAAHGAVLGTSAFLGTVALVRGDHCSAAWWFVLAVLTVARTERRTVKRRRGTRG